MVKVSFNNTPRVLEVSMTDSVIPPSCILTVSAGVTMLGVLNTPVSLAAAEALIVLSNDTGNAYCIYMHGNTS